ncbi:MAG TPA: sigma-70 family RNA polymerase sigma factor [Dehalococcoidia bacterium]|nr:sigma-70 family RNA polymerase sigma factor [Dehalococcoidia bacterium]
MRRSNPHQADECELIALAAHGDREAFGTLYERYILRVFRHIYFLTSDPHLAEDLTAQTFLKALEAIPRYEVRGAPFLAWLLRIATNITVNHRKARANGNAHLPEIVEATGVSYSPEDSCEAKVDAQRVWEGVRRLRGDQRQVIVMRFVDGLSYPDIAQLLGKSIGAVRVIQFRALASLRHMLDEEEEQRLPTYARSRAG